MNRINVLRNIIGIVTIAAWDCPVEVVDDCDWDKKTIT